MILKLVGNDSGFVILVSALFSLELEGARCLLYNYSIDKRVKHML